MSAKAIHKAHSIPNDCIFTPKPIAELMIEMCDIKEYETVLDPSRGLGVFYDNLPPCHKDYCEISEGMDYFENKQMYNCIIGNPPYSKWTKWIQHTITKCDRFCYIFGSNNLTPNRIKMIHDAGFGITKMHTVKVAWWMSQSFIVLCEKGKPSMLTVTPGTFKCEHCGTMCGRGINGADPNICNYEKKMEKRNKN